MTDWIEHTTDTCPVDPDTVVEVRHTKHHRVSSGKALYMAWGRYSDRLPGDGFGTPVPEITHYRIITPAKPPEPEMAYSYPDDAEAYAQSQVRPEMNADAAATLKRRIADAYRAGEDAQALKAKARAKPEPDLITLRLECLKLAVNDHFYEAGEPDYEKVADRFLHYVLNGSVDKAP